MQSWSETEQSSLAQRLPNCRDISCKPGWTMLDHASSYFSGTNQRWLLCEASSSFSGQVPASAWNKNIGPTWSNTVPRRAETRALKTVVNMNRANSDNSDNRNPQLVLDCDPSPQLQRTASTRSCRDIENSCSLGGLCMAYINLIYMMSWVISLMQIRMVKNWLLNTI